VDGNKAFGVTGEPQLLSEQLERELGAFPFPQFWGPMAGAKSTVWIAAASARVVREHKPTLTLVYLPHLDYGFQRLGASDPTLAQDIQTIDAEAGKVIDAARRQGAEIVVLSEYAITDVSRPVHINRVLREHGYLEVRREPLGWETLDPGASRAFAVSDHQVAHVYVQDPADLKAVAELLKRTEGIDQVLDRTAQAEFGIDHERAGELVVVAAPDAWFTYYFWLDDALAPDYARTVDIHRKPGYDPTELFFDPHLKSPRRRAIRRLIQKKLGFRYYMDVIGLDATVVKGSHGRLPSPGRETTEGPVFIASSRSIERDEIPMTAVKQMLLDLQFAG